MTTKRSKLVSSAPDAPKSEANFRLRSPREMDVVEQTKDIPTFSNEDEEHAYWETHRLADSIFDQMGPEDDGLLPPIRPRTTPVPIRFSDDVITRVKALAARHNKGYQTLLKEFVTERLYEEEKRQGLR